MKPFLPSSKSKRPRGPLIRPPPPFPCLLTVNRGQVHRFYLIKDIHSIVKFHLRAPAVRARSTGAVQASGSHPSRKTIQFARSSSFSCYNLFHKITLNFSIRRKRRATQSDSNRTQCGDVMACPCLCSVHGDQGTWKNASQESSRALQSVSIQICAKRNCGCRFIALPRPTLRHLISRIEFFGG